MEQMTKEKRTKCSSHSGITSSDKCSIQFSRSVVSDSLQPHEMQHTRPPCPSPTPGVYTNPRPLSWWCHPTISSSVVPFFSCPQSLPASGSFPMSQLFASGGQSIGVSASTSVLPMNSCSSRFKEPPLWQIRRPAGLFMPPLVHPVLSWAAWLVMWNPFEIRFVPLQLLFYYS